MRTVKFLGERLLDVLDWLHTTGFPDWWKILFGLFEILLAVAVFFVSWIFTNGYLALAITVGFILGVCILCCLIELAVALIARLVKK